MRAYIFEPDSNIQEYYRNLFQSEMRGLELHFFTSAETMRRKIAEQPCDLIITESLGSTAAVELIEEMSQKRIPVIVVSEVCNERLIVECMKAGALDFISKRNIKLNLLLDAVRRTLLEADRWMEVQGVLSRMPARPEFVKATQVLRGAIQAEQAEVRRLRIKNAPDEAGTYEEGRSYNLAFVFLQLLFPPSVQNASDERGGRIVHDVLDRITGIPVRYGGEVWVRRRDGGIFVFPGQAALGAFLCCVEIRGLLNIVNVTTENLYESIHANLAITSGMTVYRKNVGDVHSDALNLAAHLALQYPRQNSILVPSTFVDQLGARAKKYFFRGEIFEGKEISVYENVV